MSNISNQPNLKKELTLLLISFLISIFLIKKIFKSKNPSIKIRLLLIIFSLIILFFPIFFTKKYNIFITNNKIDLYLWQPIINCNQNGILFCFYDDLKNIRNPSPENYNQQNINQIYSNLPSLKETSRNSEAEGLKPNVIVIMSEALFDVTQLPEIKYSQDPIKNIRSDIKSTFISPIFGGATANVEFELLTSFSNFFLNGKIPYSQSIRKDMPSLFSLFKEQGYLTTTIHPFYGSVFNRITVYKHFSLDKFINLDNSSDYVNAGPFVSDQSFTTKVINQLNSSNQPQFIFAISIQNHASFEANRFPNHKINITSSLEGDNKSALQTYIDGINLSDESYLNLKNELNKSKKPTIIILYGDHLPFLGNDFDIYKKVDYIPNNQLDWSQEDYRKMYSTPIAVFANFKTNFDFPKEMSPSFLSLEILKSANITPKYQFSYLQSIFPTDSVLNVYIPPKFTPEQLKDYELVQYDLIFGKQYGLK